MITFAVIQIFLSSLGICLSTLYKYHYANLVAQVCMIVYSLVPVDIARLFGILTLGIGSVSSIFSWFLSFVRFWRYLFFPTRQNFVFFAECLANFLLTTPQAIFFMYQAKQLAFPDKFSMEIYKTVKKLSYKHVLYTHAVKLLFFHDFLYAAILYNIGTWYEFFGITQFITHALMMFIPRPVIVAGKVQEANVFRGFVLVWIALFVQHVFTIIFTFTDETLSEGLLMESTPIKYVIWLLCGVYIVALTVYLLNAAVLFRVDPCLKLRPKIDEFVNKVDGFFGKASKFTRARLSGNSKL